MDDDFASPADVERALSSERTTNVLMRALRPGIQSEIGYALIPAARGRRRDPRQEIHDLVQDVFITLLKDDAKTLRAWDPQHGLSLERFVRMIARRYVVGALRSGVRNPFASTTLTHEQLDSRPDPATRRADEELATRDELDSLLTRLERNLTARSLRLFRLLYVEERSIAEVCEIVESKPAAIYTWRMRFRAQLRELRQEQS